MGAGRRAEKLATWRIGGKEKNAEEEAAGGWKDRGEEVDLVSRGGR